MSIFAYRRMYLMILVSLVIISCSKTEEGIAPRIWLRETTGLISGDTLLWPGDQFRIGISCVAGSVNMTNLIIKLNGEPYYDTGTNNSILYIEKTLTKGAAVDDNWEFIIRDKNGLSSSVSIKVIKDPDAVFGPVSYFQNVTLGAQNNVSEGSFFNLFSGNICNLEQAWLIQDSIELLYYYDFTGDENTVASPNASIDTSYFGGPHGIFFWTIKNETRYFETTLSVTDFDNCNNDSLLLASYDEINSKRKAKNLVAGEIYSFKTAHLKYGLFRVVQLSGTDTGSISLDIKIQQ